MASEPIPAIPELLQIDALLAQLQGRIADLPGVVAAQAMLDSQAVANRLAGTRSLLIARADGTDGWHEPGSSATLPSWLAFYSRVNQAGARLDVKTARLLRAHASLFADAFHAGLISDRHVWVVVQDALSIDERVERFSDVEQELLDVALVHDPKVLRQVIKAWISLLEDEKDCDDSDEAAYERRYLHLSETTGGFKIDGFLSAEDGAKLAAALAGAMSGRFRAASKNANAGTTEDQPAEPASTSRADALMDIVDLALAKGDLPESGGQKPTVIVTVPVERIHENGDDPNNGANREGADSTGTNNRTSDDEDLGGEDCESADEGSHPRTTQRGVPFIPDAARVSIPNGAGGGIASMDTVLRLLCDCDVQRLLMTADSVPLDIGRKTRVIPNPMRIALYVRDGGCIFPGCDRPPGWCEAHHVTHWAHGGTTSLDNLVLLCSKHHHAVHSHALNIGFDNRGLPNVTANRKHAKYQFWRTRLRQDEQPFPRAG